MDGVKLRPIEKVPSFYFTIKGLLQFVPLHLTVDLSCSVHMVLSSCLSISQTSLLNGFTVSSRRDHFGLPLLRFPIGLHSVTFWLSINLVLLSLNTHSISVSFLLNTSLYPSLSSFDALSPSLVTYRIL